MTTAPRQTVTAEGSREDARDCFVDQLRDELRRRGIDTTEPRVEGMMIGACIVGTGVVTSADMITEILGRTGR